MNFVSICKCRNICTCSQVFFPNERDNPHGDHHVLLIKSSEMPSMTTQKRTNGCLSGTSGGTSKTKHLQSNIPASLSRDLNVSVTMDPTPAQPPAIRGIGTDIAILDSAYLLSQVLPSLFMGSLVQLFQSVTIYMACASLLSVVAVYFSRKIVFEKADMEACR